MQQREHEYKDLHRALQFIGLINDDTPKPQMYPTNIESDVYHNFLCIANTVLEMLDNDVETYWLSKGFIHCVSKFEADVPRLTESILSLLEKEDNELFRCFVITLTTHDLLRICSYVAGCGLSCLPETPACTKYCFRASIINMDVLETRLAEPSFLPSAWIILVAHQTLLSSSRLVHPGSSPNPPPTWFTMKTRRTHLSASHLVRCGNSSNIPSNFLSSAKPLTFPPHHTQIGPTKKGYTSHSGKKEQARRQKEKSLCAPHKGYSPVASNSMSGLSRTPERPTVTPSFTLPLLREPINPPCLTSVSIILHCII
ncbi:unnamed protein product, partial [Timema podura]|nr:unnamed protein product [Timema podura]